MAVRRGSRSRDRDHVGAISHMASGGFPIPPPLVDPYASPNP